MKVAVVGVGVMGSAIAGRLLDTGATVYLFDVEAVRCAPLSRRGAFVASSARSAAEAVEFVITSLNSAAIVARAVFGSEGIAAGGRDDKVLVDMSSIDPVATAAMAARLSASNGMAWVDAPLSGGAPAALRGTLH